MIAGLDIALHDLYARRMGLSLAQFLNKNSAMAVPTYASGIAIGVALDLIAQARVAGHDAFKVKIGFDGARDLAALRKVSENLKSDEHLMADVNQAWSVEEALSFAFEIDALDLSWLEEPIQADLPTSDWAKLAASYKTPLRGN